MGSSGPNKFIERSIMEALAFLKEAVFSDEYASRKGFMQSLDPRIKTITVFVFILTALFTRSMVTCACLYALCLMLAVLSKIDLIFFLKRTWVFIPVFSVFIAIPAVFSVFTPGHPVATFKIFGLGMVITRQGLAGAVLFVSRVTVSVSFAVLLSITTRHFELLKVLRIFRVPAVFVMILGICYRYIYLFIEIVENTYIAVKSRTGGSIHYRKGQHIVAWNMASLWHRSYRLNEEVYGAMVSRGYDGEPVVRGGFKTGSRDWVWLAFALLASAASFYLGRGLA